MSNTYTVVIKERSFTDNQIIPVFNTTVQGYSWHRWGGPDRSKIVLTGNIDVLKTTFDLLRCPIEIYNERATRTWWGYVHSVALQMDNLECSFSLDDMANDVAVKYSKPAVGSGTQTSDTDFASTSTDSRSINEYGRKQARPSLNAANSALADGLSAELLDRVKDPFCNEVQVKSSKDVKAILSCKGWFHSLDWHFPSAETATQINVQGSTETSNYLDFGDAVARRYYAQRFQVTQAKGFSLQYADIFVRKDAATDDIKVEIWTDVAGNPGTLVAGASNVILNANITSNSIASPVATTFGNISLSPGTDYHIMLSRNPDPTNTTGKFQLSTVANYVSGTLQISPDQAGWTDQTTDMNFVIGGARSTEVLISEILASDAGQFFVDESLFAANVLMYPLNASSVRYNALQIVKRLLDYGTSNGRELTVIVTPERNFTMDEQIVAASDNLRRLNSDGNVLDSSGELIPGSELERVVGYFVRPEVADFVGNISVLKQLNQIYIEAADYNVQQGTLRLRPLRAGNPFEISTIKEK